MKKRKGNIFFLLLIIISGVCVFSLLFLAFEGDKVTVYTIEKYVLASGLFEREITDEVNPEEKKQVILDLRRFFISAKSGHESKQKIANVGEKLKEIMLDNKINRKEIKALEAILKD